MNNITKRIFLIFLTVCMGLFTLNNTLFLHTHILSGGELVIHAHPFKAKVPDDTSGTGAPGIDHTHNRAQFILFGQAEQMIPWMTLLILMIISISVVPLFFTRVNFPGQVCLPGTPTRGPPAAV